MTKEELFNLLCEEYGFDKITDEYRKKVYKTYLSQIVDDLYDESKKEVFPLGKVETMTLRKKNGILDGKCLNLDEISKELDASPERIFRRLNRSDIKIHKFCTDRKKFVEFKLTDTKRHDNLSIEEMNLSPRSYNCLKRHGISTLEDFKRVSTQDLKEMRNLGNKCMEEIIIVVHGYGMNFADDKAKEDSKNKVIEVSQETDMEIKAQKALKLTLEEVNFPLVIRNKLKRQGIKTLEDLIKFKTTDVCKVPSIGPARSEKIIGIVHSYGLVFIDEQKESPTVKKEEDIMQTVIARRTALIERYKELQDAKRALIDKSREIDEEISMVLKGLASVKESGENETRAKAKTIKGNN